MATNATDLNIGGIGGGFSDGNYKGTQQHLALFNRALSATEFLKIAKLGGFA